MERKRKIELQLVATHQLAHWEAPGSRLRVYLWGWDNDYKEALYIVEHRRRNAKTWAKKFLSPDWLSSEEFEVLWTEARKEPLTTT